MYLSKEAPTVLTGSSLNLYRKTYLVLSTSLMLPRKKNLHSGPMSPLDPGLLEHKPKNT